VPSYSTQIKSDPQFEDEKKSEDKIDAKIEKKQVGENVH